MARAASTTNSRRLPSYSVDERWLVPHFEKMSTTNSELLQRTFSTAGSSHRTHFCAETAEGIIGWVNEVLSDQDNGGFYASQDADYRSMMTATISPGVWTNSRSAPPRKARVMELYYDVEAHGEMHHNHAKNVL